MVKITNMDRHLKKLMAKISPYRAESILANLILFKVLIMNASEKGFSYEINPDDPLNFSQ